MRFAVGHFISTYPGKGRVGFLVMNLGYEWIAYANVSIVDGPSNIQASRFDWNIAAMAVIGVILVSSIATIFYFIGRKNAITQFRGSNRRSEYD